MTEPSSKQPHASEKAVVPAPGRGARLLRWCAAIAWVSWGLSISLLWGEYQATVLHPRAFLFLLLLALTALSALVGGCWGLWRFLRGPRRRAALGWGLAAVTPLVAWLLLTGYVLDLADKNDFPHNAFTQVASMAITSAMEAQALTTYPQRLESRRLVMFYDGRVTDPQRDIEEMDRHVARLEKMTEKPLREKIYWIRGPLLGRGPMAIAGLALGSGQSPHDWETADHPERLSVDRHELAHAVLHQQQPPHADPPTLLIEGWAESQSGTTSQKRAEWARESRELWRASTGAGPASSYLRELTEPAWYHHIDSPVYSVGGALADFLLRRYGVQRFLGLYFGCRPGRFEAECRRHLDVDLDALEPEFWAWVDRTARTPAP
jgi:hypothetical protein